MPPAAPAATRRIMLQFRDFKLTDLVRETLNRFTWSGHIVLDQELLEDDALKKNLVIHGDEAYVADALFTLVTNSVNALPNGTGTIRVRTGKMRCTRALLDSDTVFFGRNREEANYAYIEIFDTGTGLSEEERKSLFVEPEPERAPISRRNGMMSVIRLVQTHSCAVEVQSRTQRFVTIRLLFSLARMESGKRRRMVL